MNLNKTRADVLTIASLAVAAACVVTATHEALGHGGTCVAVGGRITLLTSSLFRCAARSNWIAMGGPAANLIAGTLAVLAVRQLRNVALRLFLIMITAFSYFWEGGYLVKAMVTRDGDLYFFARSLLGLGAPELWWRVAGSVAGAALYITAIRATASSLGALWPAPEARRIARMGWLAATIATTLAALLYHGPDGVRDVTDTLLEIGIASLPLLILPFPGVQGPDIALPRNAAAIALSVATFIIFAMTLGHGIY